MRELLLSRQTLLPLRRATSPPCFLGNIVVNRKIGLRLRQGRPGGGPYVKVTVRNVEGPLHRGKRFLHRGEPFPRMLPWKHRCQSQERPAFAARKARQRAIFVEANVQGRMRPSRGGERPFSLPRCHSSAPQRRHASVALKPKTQTVHTVGKGGFVRAARGEATRSPA